MFEFVLFFFYLGLVVKKIYYDSDDDDFNIDVQVLQVFESMKIFLEF